MKNNTKENIVTLLEWIVVLIGFGCLGNIIITQPIQKYLEQKEQIEYLKHELDKLKRKTETLHHTDSILDMDSLHLHSSRTSNRDTVYNKPR